MDELAQENHQHVATYAERLRYEKLWSCAQRHTGKNTTVTRHRDDYKEALAKFREAKKAAVARGEVVTQGIPRKDRVRQRGAHSQEHAQQESQQARIGMGRLGASSWQSDPNQNWWSSISSSHWLHG